MHGTGPSGDDMEPSEIMELRHVKLLIQNAVTLLISSRNLAGRESFKAFNKGNALLDDAIDKIDSLCEIEDDEVYP